MIDLADGAANCNCPAKRFPCKHSLGMFLYFANQPAAFHPQEPPAWANVWIQKRMSGAEKKVKQEEESLDVEKVEEKKAKQGEKAQQKLEGLKSGLQDAILWAEDLMRIGLAEVEQDQQFGEQQKAWFSNLKAEGLRYFVVELVEILENHASEDYLARFQKKLGEFYLLLKTLERAERFSPEFQQSLMYESAGFVISKNELMETGAESMQGKWLIVGQRKEDNPDRPNVVMRHTFLYGLDSHTTHYIMDSSFGGNFEEHFGVVGAVFEGELMLFPGITRQRVAVKSYQRTELNVLPEFTDTESNLNRYAAILGEFPWLRQFVFLLKDMRLLPVENKWYLMDGQNKLLPLHISPTQAHHLLAIGGGNPMQISGVWKQNALTPLAAWLEGQVYPVV